MEDYIIFRKYYIDELTREPRPFEQLIIGKYICTYIGHPTAIRKYWEVQLRAQPLGKYDPSVVIEVEGYDTINETTTEDELSTYITFK